MLSVNFCSMCFFNVSILHPRSYIEVISLSLLNQYKHDLGRPQQSVQCDRMRGGFDFVFHVHKFGFHHKKDMLIFSCWAHKSHPATIFGLWSYLVVVKNLTSTTIFAFWSSLVVFAYLASATVIMLIFVFRVYTWLIVLTFCRYPSTFCNILLIVFGAS